LLYDKGFHGFQPTECVNAPLGARNRPSDPPSWPRISDINRDCHHCSHWLR